MSVLDPVRIEKARQVLRHLGYTDIGSAHETPVVVGLRTLGWGDPYEGNPLDKAHRELIAFSSRRELAQLEDLAGLGLGERIRVLRALAERLRPWCPAAADELESYGSGT